MSGLLPRNLVYDLKMAHPTLLHGDDDHDDAGFGCHEILQNSDFDPRLTWLLLQIEQTCLRIV
jgi:hypothetical protein